jgi:predicted nucleotidyltransferase
MLNRMSDTRLSDPILQRLRNRIAELEGDRLLQVILFGSRAKGGAKPTSDYDLLVVLRGGVDHAAEEARLYRQLRTLCAKADVHVYGDEEYQEEASVPGTVAFPAARHGIVLYAAA